MSLLTRSRAKRSTRGPRWWSAPLWAATGMMAGAVGGATGLAVARLVFGYALLTMPSDMSVVQYATVAAVLGTVSCGIVGAFVGAAINRWKWGGVSLGWGVSGAVMGGLVSGMGPLAIAMTGDALGPELSLILMLSMVGLLFGIIAYVCTLIWTPPPDETDEEATPQHPGIPEPPARFGPLGRVLLVGAVSVGCLLAVAVKPASPAGWAIMAVGMLGLSVAWALYGQEKRIRELERQLGAKDTSDDDTGPGW